MPLCVGVDPKKEIIFSFADLHCTVEIATFEPRLKDEFVLDIDGRVHSLKSPIVNLILIELIMDHRILNP